MPIPKPSKGEKWDEFITRCMNDNIMIKEYKDEKQRFAICSRAYETVEVDLKINEEEQEVIVFPFRRIWLDNYMQWKDFNLELANEIINNFKNPDVIKPIIDKEHEYKESYGDILDLYTKEDGLYAKIRLNPAGVELVKNRIYKGLSPSIGTYVDVNKVEHKNVLLALSLVNYQGLGTLTPELQEQIKLKLDLYNKFQGGKMELKEKFKKIANILELKIRQDISDEEIDSILAKIEELKQYAVENEELKKKIEELQSQIQSLKEMEEGIKQSEAEQAVNEAVEAGYIPVTLKDVYKKRYLENREEFLLEMKERSKNKPKVEMKAKNLKPIEDDVEIDSKMRALMLKARIDINDKQAVKNFIEYFNSKGGN